MNSVVAKLLRLAGSPLGRTARGDLAREHGADEADIEAFAGSLVEEGVLVGDVG